MCVKGVGFAAALRVLCIYSDFCKVNVVDGDVIDSVAWQLQQPTNLDGCSHIFTCPATYQRNKLVALHH